MFGMSSGDGGGISRERAGLGGLTWARLDGLSSCLRLLVFFPFLVFLCFLLLPRFSGALEAPASSSRISPSSEDEEEDDDDEDEEDEDESCGALPGP